MLLQKNKSKFQYAAVIVLYKPELDLLSRNINQVLKTPISLLILVDNSPSVLDCQFLQSFNSSNIAYVYNNGNKGIAYGLNDGLKIAESHGYNWVLQLDQDSIIPIDMIDVYDAFLSYNDDNVGLLCPKILQGEEKETGDGTCISYALFAITSGSLINISAWNDIGCYDEKLFIDGVDHDLCIRLRQKNYLIVQFDQLYLNHRLGIIKIKKILGHKIRVKVGYPPLRMYYIVRNYHYIKRKYITPELASHPVFNQKLWKKFRIIILFEKNKIQYLLAILFAYYYYHKGEFKNFEDIVNENGFLRYIFH